MCTHWICIVCVKIVWLFFNLVIDVSFYITETFFSQILFINMYLTLFLIKVLTMSNYTLNLKTRHNLETKLSNFVGKGKEFVLSEVTIKRLVIQMGILLKVSFWFFFKTLKIFLESDYI